MREWMATEMEVAGERAWPVELWMDRDGVVPALPQLPSPSLSFHSYYQPYWLKEGRNGPSPAMLIYPWCKSSDEREEGAVPTAFQPQRQLMTKNQRKKERKKKSEKRKTQKGLESEGHEESPDSEAEDSSYIFRAHEKSQQRNAFFLPRRPPPSSGEHGRWDVRPRSPCRNQPPSQRNGAPRKYSFLGARWCSCYK